MTHRVAVVTGANRGIGAVIAVALARDGYRVAATARDSSTLADTVGAVTGAGGVAEPLACDVVDEASVADLAAAVGRSVRCKSSSRTPGSPGRPHRCTELTLAQWWETLEARDRSSPCRR